MDQVVIFVDSSELTYRYRGEEGFIDEIIQINRLRLFFGRGFEPSTIHQNRDIWPYKVVKDGDLRRIEDKSGNTFTIEDLMKEGLSRIKINLKQLKINSSKAVLIVPSFFNVATRKAMTTAFQFHDILLFDVINYIPTLLDNDGYVLERPLRLEGYTLAFGLGTGEVIVYDNQKREMAAACEMFEINLRNNDLIHNDIMNDFLKSMNMTIDIESESFLDAQTQLHKLLREYETNRDSMQEINFYKLNDGILNEFEYKFKLKKKDGILENHECSIFDKLHYLFKKINITYKDVTDIVVYYFWGYSKISFPEIQNLFHTYLKKYIPSILMENLQCIYTRVELKKIVDKFQKCQISKLTDSLNTPPPNAIITWNDTTSMNTIELRKLFDELKLPLSDIKEHVSEHLETISQLNAQLDDSKRRLRNTKENESKNLKIISQLNAQLDDCKSELRRTKESESEHLRTISQLNEEVNELRMQPCITKEIESKHLIIISQLNAQLDEWKNGLCRTKENEDEHLRTISQLNAQLDEWRSELYRTKEHLGNIIDLKSLFDDLEIGLRRIDYSPKRERLVEIFKMKKLLDGRERELCRTKEIEGEHLRTISQLNAQLDKWKSELCRTKGNEGKHLGKIIQLNAQLDKWKNEFCKTKENENKYLEKIIQMNELLDMLESDILTKSSAHYTITKMDYLTKFSSLKYEFLGMEGNEDKHPETISQLKAALDEWKNELCRTKENEDKLLETISQLNAQLGEWKNELCKTIGNEAKHLKSIRELNAKLDESKIQLSTIKQNESRHLNNIDELNNKFDELKIQKANIETRLITLELQNSIKKLDETKIAGIDFTQNRCKATFVDQMQLPIWESASELELKQEAFVQMFKELKEKANIEGGVVAVDGNMANPVRRDIVLSAMMEFSVLRVVNATTAILAANECFNDAKNRCVLVLDINYQRFQATVVRLENQRSKLILKTTTDQFTEAKFDEALLKYCCEQFCNFTNLDLLTIDSPVVEKALQQLKNHALEAKERLRVLDSTRIDTGPLYCDQVLDIIFSRTTCQHIVTKFMDDIPKYIFQCLRGKDLQRHEITDVILVGDFAQFLDHMFNQNFPRANVHKTEDSNEIVAQGAAILAKAAFKNPIDRVDQLIEPREAIIE